MQTTHFGLYVACLTLSKPRNTYFAIWINLSVVCPKCQRKLIKRPKFCPKFVRNPWKFVRTFPVRKYNVQNFNVRNFSFLMYVSKKTTLVDLPPTSSSIHGHLERCHYVIRQYISLLDRHFDGNPCHYGWFEESGVLLPDKRFSPLPKFYTVRSKK